VEGDQLLTQLVSEPTREGAPLDLLFVNREGLVDNVMVVGCLGHSDHAMIELSVLREIGRAVSRTTTLDFWRAETLTCLGAWLTESPRKQS